MQKKRKRVWLALGGLLLVLYVAAYVALSRRGYAEAGACGFQGFYYFTPENSDEWRFRNEVCRWGFYPLNAIDVELGLGRPQASDSMWGLSK